MVHGVNKEYASSPELQIMKTKVKPETNNFMLSHLIPSMSVKEYTPQVAASLKEDMVAWI